MPIAQFTAFYPSRPFWAVSKIDFYDPAVLDKFEELMAEETYQEANESFTVKICRDGMIMLRIEALETEIGGLEPRERIDAIVERWGRYLDYLNTFYLLLDSAAIKTTNLQYFHIHEITTRDAFRIRYENGKIGGYDLKRESAASVFQLGRLKAAYGRIPIENDPRIVGRYIISSATIENAVQQFKRVFTIPDLERILASFAKSISEYKVGNYETAIVLAWFITERIVNQQWQSHLTSLARDEENGQQRISAERGKFLTGRDFTASIITNILEMFGVLSFGLFKDIDTVRRLRNKIAHGDSRSTPNASDGQLAITTALDWSR